VPNEGEVRFRYRHDGMRVEKQVVGGLTTKYVYDGQTVIGEIRSDGTKRWYVVGAMGYICRIDEDANGQILARDYFVYDGLGSCRALVASNGVVVAKYDYDAYGAIRGQEGQRSNNFKYVAQIGHPTDEETGLIYMRARYYDPEVGRFVSEDPGWNGVNWYQYTEADPINKVDLTGRESKSLEEFWKGVEEAHKYVDLFFLAKDLIGLGANLIALIDFIRIVLKATDPLDVEITWGKFMNRWNSSEIEYSLDAANYIAGQIIFGGGPARVFMQGVTTGGRLATLVIGYAFRIAFT